MQLLCTLGRKVSIKKVDAQSCLYYMLKSNILATFCSIAFENPFNGAGGLDENSNLDFTQKIYKYSIRTTLLFLGKFALSTITQPIHTKCKLRD